MRKIKFRGLCVNGKGWVKGYLSRIEDVRTWVIVDWDNKTFYFVIPESIGQFTGLCDKNGKEIYEGDKTSYGVIMWNSEKALFAEHFYQEVTRKWSVSSYPISVDRMEIIGNIHETPELL